MFSLRVTKTSSKASAVQVVWYENRKVMIARHIGSAHNDQELVVLKEEGLKWIFKNSNQNQPSLFPELQFDPSLFSLDRCQYLGVSYLFIYECLSQIFIRFGFGEVKDRMLLDLALIRIIQPASLLSSFELLQELFNLKYSRLQFYRHIATILEQKEAVKTAILKIAKLEFGFDFTLVFYDVTTLYFESFKSDELRKPGFSKDGKSAQPQILIGLMVDHQGFPVDYEIFEGNKFEGHTMLPVILAFKQRHMVEKLTIVADAGMVSLDTITKLKENGLSYIVGARMASLPEATMRQISSRLGKKDKETIRITTTQGELVCDFSQIRYDNDKREMDKQISKAKVLVQEPGRIKRAKFLKNGTQDKASFELNEELVKKTEGLLGIKGYLTNLELVDNHTIINQYHSLWHVEHSFRIAKSDLQTRPIYHFKKEPIQAHILICFTALAVAKYMELKTGKSINKIVTQLRSITDAKILNTITGETTIMRSALSEDIRDIVDKLGLLI